MTRRYRVAMVAACPFPCPRGTPIRIYRMAEALTRRGHEVHVVTYHLGQDEETAPFAVHRIPPMHGYRRLAPGPTAGKLMLLDPMLVLALRRLLARYPFDVIHAHHYEGLLVARCGRGPRALPIVYDAHTLLEAELPYYSLGLPRSVKRAVGRALDRRLPGHADHVIAVTDNIRNLLVDSGIVPAERISVAESGVELEAFQVARDHTRQQRCTSELIFAGNLAPYQRIDLLVRSFRVVVDARSDVRLLMVGSTSLEQYDALARELGVRELIQTAPSDFGLLPAHLADADIALNPRTACAGMPQKVLNYMAAGKPIVSFAGSAKTLEHGRTAWVVPDEDTDAFGRAVLHLLNEPGLAQALGAAAQRYVMDHYSWDRTAELAEAVYERVTENGAR